MIEVLANDAGGWSIGFIATVKDEKLLVLVPWHRIVLDEAQNIKNPTTTQTKAILKLKANQSLNNRVRKTGFNR